MLEWWASLTTNPVFGGFLGGAVVAGALWLLRNIPGQIYHFVLWRFGTSLMVFSEDAAFERMNEWLSSLEYTKRYWGTSVLVPRSADSSEAIHSRQRRARHLEAVRGHRNQIVWLAKPATGSCERREACASRAELENHQRVHLSTPLEASS